MRACVVCWRAAASVQARRPAAATDRPQPDSGTQGQWPSGALPKPRPASLMWLLGTGLAALSTPQGQLYRSCQWPCTRTQTPRKRDSTHTHNTTAVRQAAHAVRGCCSDSQGSDSSTGQRAGLGNSSPKFRCFLIARTHARRCAAHVHSAVQPLRRRCTACSHARAAACGRPHACSARPPPLPLHAARPHTQDNSTLGGATAQRETRTERSALKREPCFSAPGC